MQMNLVLLATLASSFLSIANGVAVDARAALIVYDPQIISPNASTIWVVGDVETVTWNTSTLPLDMFLPGSISLRSPVGQLPFTGAPLGNVDLRSGSADITVPNSITPGQYAITLFGDSGNISPTFEIVAAN